MPEVIVEKAAPEATLEPAGLITRSISFFVDALIIAALYTGSRFGMIAVKSMLVLSLPRLTHFIGEVFTWTTSFLLIPTYYILFWTVAARTPGKWLLGLRLVTKDGKKVRFGRACLRFVAFTVSIAPFFVGLIAIAFDRRRRAWHDRIAGTLVVYDRAPKRPTVQLKLSPASR
jgi:uncharacterized RDD family membrane protein YckC